MGVDNYKTVPKMGVEKLIEETLNCECIMTNPIEHYSIEEIRRLSELARKNDLIFSIKEERSNFYQGIMISLVKRTRVKECECLINYI